MAYLALRNATRSAFVRRADGSDREQAAVPGDPRLDEIWLGPAGYYTMLRTQGSGPGSRHLLVFESGTDSVRTLLDSRFDHYSATLSPDGHEFARLTEAPK